MIETAILDCTFEQYLEMIRSFHGSTAPGMIAGGFMIDCATKNLPDGEFFDVLCETRHCLADAVQLLTPCTVGNGWLKISETGRFSLTFYNKFNGEGVRIYIDPVKLDKYPEVRCWFLQEKDKPDQDLKAILDEFVKAGHDLYGTERVTLKDEYISSRKRKKTESFQCRHCGESFKSDEYADICPVCLGSGPYVPR